MQIWLSFQTALWNPCVYLSLYENWDFSWVLQCVHRMVSEYCMYRSVCLLPYELETPLNLLCCGSGVWFRVKVPSIIIWHSHRRSVSCEALLSRTFWSVTVLSVWGWHFRSLWVWSSNADDRHSLPLLWPTGNWTHQSCSNAWVFLSLTLPLIYSFLKSSFDLQIKNPFQNWYYWEHCHGFMMVNTSIDDIRQCDFNLNIKHKFT